MMHETVFGPRSCIMHHASRIMHHARVAHGCFVAFQRHSPIEPCPQSRLTGSRWRKPATCVLEVNSPFTWPSPTGWSKFRTNELTINGCGVVTRTVHSG